MPSSPILTKVQGCTPLLRDPFNAYWALSTDDDGDLTITKVQIVPYRQNPPALQIGYAAWQLAVDATEAITVTKVANPGQIKFPYIPLNSPGGIPWKLTVTQEGELQTTATSTLLPDVIPLPSDITMSVYGTDDLLFCNSCGNASVTALADLGLWCCSCSSYVLPEDTNIIVVLDE